MSLKSKLKKKVKPQTDNVSARPTVSQGAEPKSGCLWCSLMPWCGDFSEHETSYQRNAEAVWKRESEGHLIKSRCVTEEWDEVDVLFVSEAPGGDEDNQGVPMGGRSGSLLRTSIAEFMTEGWKVGITNLVRCRPPRNRKTNKTEVRSCSPELIREIKARKPKLVVALGNNGLDFLAGQTGITTFSGKFLDSVRPEFPGLKVLGCLHPSYVLRFDHELQNFVDVLQTADDFLRGDYVEKQGIGEYFTLTEIEDVEALLQSFADGGRRVSFDTETGSLNWWQTEFPHLLCFSFSDEAGYGFTVPFDHAESPWCVGGPKEHERPRLIKALVAFFGDPDIDKCAQNGKFDKKHILAALDVEILRVKDTMLTHHAAVDERRGTHGLKTLSYAYSGMGGYEKEMDDWKKTHRECDPEKGGSYANFPGEMLFRYGAMDADVTVRVDEELRASEGFQRENVVRLADDFLPLLSDALCEVEWNGAHIDTSIVEELDELYAGDMERIGAEIRTLNMVSLFEMGEYFSGKTDCTFNPGSSKQLQNILFDPAYYGERPVNLTKGGLERLGLRFKKAKAKWKDTRKGKAPEFMDIVSSAIEKREWQHFSTDAEVLNEMDRRGNELAKKILAYREAQTLHGTFVIPLKERLDVEGRIHGEYLIHGTVTSRLASRNPNLQNIPNKGGKKIKQAYISRFGFEGVLLQLDYSQVELRVAASLFNEPSMIEAYNNGVDVHTMTAIDVSGFTELEYASLDSDERGAWRSRAKRINFGILYGGGPPALVNTLKKDGIFITVDEAQDLIDRYFKVRPALKRGIENLEKDVRKTGFLETFTGRRRRVPEVRSVDEELVARALRQSVNFPVQSTASDMTMLALVLIQREMKKRKLRSKISLTVHDSIITDCHVDEFEEVALLQKEIMENLPLLSDQVLPGLDWSWLKCPIVADAEIGISWGTQVEFDPTDFDIDELWETMTDKHEKAVAA